MNGYLVIILNKDLKCEHRIWINANDVIEARGKAFNKIL